MKYLREKFLTQVIVVLHFPPMFAVFIIIIITMIMYTHTRAHIHTKHY